MTNPATKPTPSQRYLRARRDAERLIEGYAWAASSAATAAAIQHHLSPASSRRLDEELNQAQEPARGTRPRTRT